MFGFQRQVAQAESSGRLNVRNPRSGAYGLFQFVPATWATLSAREGGLDPNTEEGQTRAFDRLTAENRQLLRARLGRDPTEQELYYAHVLGGPAAAATLASPDAPFGATLEGFYAGTQTPRHAAAVRTANPDLAQVWDRPVSEVLTMYGRRIGRPVAGERSMAQPMDALHSPLNDPAAIQWLLPRLMQQGAPAEPNMSGLMQMIQRAIQQPRDVTAEYIPPPAPAPLQLAEPPAPLRREAPQAPRLPETELPARRGIAPARSPEPLGITPPSASELVSQGGNLLSRMFSPWANLYMNNIGQPFADAARSTLGLDRLDAVRESLPGSTDEFLARLTPETLASALFPPMRLLPSAEAPAGPEPYVAVGTQPLRPQPLPPPPPPPTPAGSGLPTPPVNQPLQMPDRSALMQYLQEMRPRDVAQRSPEDAAREALMAGLAGFEERPGDRLGNIMGRMAASGWQQFARGRAEDRQDARRTELNRQSSAQNMLQALLGIQNQDVQIQQANQAGRQQDYRNQLLSWQTLAQLARAQRPEAFGVPAQRALLAGMSAPFMAPAQQRVIQEMFGGDEARFRAAQMAPGSNINEIVQQMAYALMMQSPEGMRNFAASRELLRSGRPAYPTGSSE